MTTWDAVKELTTWGVAKECRVVHPTQNKNRFREQVALTTKRFAIVGEIGVRSFDQPS